MYQVEASIVVIEISDVHNPAYFRYTDCQSRYLFSIIGATFEIAKVQSSGIGNLRMVL